MDKVLVIRRTLTDTLKAIYRESNTAMDEILRKQAETIAARERMSKIIRTKPKAIQNLFFNLIIYGFNLF